MDGSSPFFVVGSDRSGTTLLRLMLNEHSMLHVPRETLFIIDLINALPLDRRLSNKERRLAFDIIVKNERWKDLEIQDNELWNNLQMLDRPYLREIIKTVFEISASRAGKPVWGDKTPDYVKEIARIHEIFPNAKFIHVIRDGRDVCLSLLKRRWIGTWVPNIARYWSDCVYKGIAAGRNLPEDRYMEVYYEDLVLNSTQVLNNVCAFLGVEFEKQMLEFYESAAVNIAPWERDLHHKTMRPPKKDDLYRWQREANPLIIGSFEAFAGDTMDLVGQRRKYRGVKKVFPWSLAVLEMLARRSIKLGKRLNPAFHSTQAKGH
jgi:hypothetical protein